MSVRLPRPGECRGCHEPIRFVRLDTGKPIPVNPRPNPEGNVAARLSGGRLYGFVISKDKRPGAGDPFRFRPHQATCSAIDRTPKRPPREADTPLPI